MMTAAHETASAPPQGLPTPTHIRDWVPPTPRNVDQTTPRDANGIFASSDLEVGFTSRFEIMWHDKGSGSGKSASFWAPVPEAGFQSLGHFCKPVYKGHYEANPNNSDVVMVVRDAVADSPEPALKSPIAYLPVWTSKGTGADLRGAFWEPVAPEGYVALGLLCTPWRREPIAPPPLNAVCCVRRDLVVPGMAVPELWNDTGSGAKGHFSVWGIGPASKPQGDVAYIGPGTFCAHSALAAPTFSSLLYVLTLPLPFQHNTSDWKPPTSPRKKKEFEDCPAGETTQLIPFPLVRDPDPAWPPVRQMKDSPIYRLTRTDTWKAYKAIPNRSSISQEHNVTMGTSRDVTETDQYAKSLGVDVSVGIEVKGIGGSVGMSYSQTWTRAVAINVGEVTTYSYTVVAAPHKVALLWKRVSVYRLYRRLGQHEELVGLQTGLHEDASDEPDSVVYDEMDIEQWDKGD